MISLIYVSSAKVPFSPPELVELLQHCRLKNAVRQITGMLLYKGGNFMQVLEGSTADVRQTYEAIERDPRHHGVLQLVEKPIAERRFSQWSMGFRDLTGLAGEIPGFTDIQREGNLSLSGSSAERLLLQFRANM